MNMKSENNIENVRNWFDNFITSVRENYENLTAEEKDTIPDNIDYRNPCQIEIFWIKDPDSQLIITTHFRELPDKEIVINGPHSRSEFLGKIKPILQKTKWQRSLHDNTNEDNMWVEVGADGEDSTYSDSLARKLHEFIEEIKRRDFSDSGMQVIGLGLSENIGHLGWVQHPFGDISKLDYSLEAKKVIKEIKNNHELKKELLTKFLTGQIRIIGQNCDGYGTHFYPPVYIGKKPKQSQEQLLHGYKIPTSFDEKALEAKFDDELVIVNKDGFIFVETSEKKTALQKLNLIMALGFFHSIPFFIVREHELVRVEIDKKLNIISSWMGGGQESLRSPLRETFSGDNYSLENTAIEVNENTILKIINEANEIWKKEALVKKLLLFLESYTHQRNNEFSPSFVRSWSIIEQYIHQAWEDSLQKRQLRPQEKNKRGNYTTDKILEDLYISGSLKNEEYGLFSDLRVKRNNLLHKSENIDKKTAAKSLGLAKGIVAQALPSSFQTDYGNLGKKIFIP